MIRQVIPADIQQICDIYNYYVMNTIITFEQKPVSYSEMKKRVEQITIAFPFYVYVDYNEVLGYSYASKWKARHSYRFSVESTVYLKNGCQGKGIGTRLYSTLLNSFSKSKIHAVIAGIALPNQRSEKLHEKFGFKKVSHFKEVGYKFNKWIDVGHWQLILR